MHDFNSVSGMWSEIWLKGSGGQRAGEGTNVGGIKTEREEEGRRRRVRGNWDGVCWGVGVAFLHIPSCLGFLDGQRRGKEGGGWRRGEGWSAGEGPEWLLSASHVSKPVLKNE